jgi:hypothetical protein
MLPSMAEPSGFTYVVRKNGDVVVMHQGITATVLRGRAAERFLSDIERKEPQQVMARVTGNYRRGNERTAARHMRNRSR